MHRHYLSWGFAQSFHRSCLMISPALPLQTQHRLLRSVELMLQSFARGLRSKSESPEQARCFATALLTLRDCRETLEESGNWVPHTDCVQRYEVLHSRLEVLCWDSASGEHGQLPFPGMGV